MKPETSLIKSLVTFSTSIITLTAFLEIKFSHANETPCPELIKELAKEYNVYLPDVSAVDNLRTIPIGNKVAQDRSKIEALEIDLLAKKISEDQFSKEFDAITLNKKYDPVYPELRPTQADIFTETIGVTLGAKYQAVIGGGRATSYPFTEEDYKKRGSNLRLLLDETMDRLIGVIVVNRKDHELAFVSVNKDCKEDDSNYRQMPLTERDAFVQQTKIAEALKVANSPPQKDAIADTSKLKSTDKPSTASGSAKKAKVKSTK